MNQEQFSNEIIDFLAERNPEIRDISIKEDTNLISVGAVDSFTLTELILFIEERLGKEIPIINFDLETFKDIKTIYNTYFQTTSV